MTQNPRKRKSDLVDSTQHEDARASKAVRSTPAEQLRAIARGERLGESADFLPLNQLSQVDGADEEDAEAVELIQGSQDVDESTLSTNILYGKLVIYVQAAGQAALNRIGRLSANQNCRCSLL